MKNCTLLALLLLTQLSASFSQSLTSKAYGSEDFDRIYDSRESADGFNYFIAGVSDSVSFLLKMDSFGDAILKRSYAVGEGILWFERVFENSTGELILTGRLIKAGNQGLFLKADAQGNVLLAKRYKLNGNSEPTIVTREVVETTDHGYAMLGYAGMGFNDWNFMWMRVDSTGKPLYHHQYGNSKDDYPIAFFNDDADGFYVVTRVGNLGLNSDAYVRIYNLDAVGNIQLAKNIVTSVAAELSACIKTAEGSYLLTGNGIDTSYVMKVNSSFDVVWIRYYSSCAFQSITVSDDSTIWLTGRVWDGQYRNTITKLSADGNHIFSRKITDYCSVDISSNYYAAIPRSNFINLEGKNIFTGYAYDCSGNPPYSDVAIYDINENGELNCASALLSVTEIEAPLPQIIYQQIDYTDSIALETNEEAIGDVTPGAFHVLCDVVNDIPAVENSSSIHIFPNPASDQLNIEVPVQTKSVYILNSRGQQVFLLESPSPIRQINCAHWAKGIYWLFITGDDGLLFKEPFILN